MELFIVCNSDLLHYKWPPWFFKSVLQGTQTSRFLSSQVDVHSGRSYLPGGKKTHLDCGPRRTGLTSPVV